MLIVNGVGPGVERYFTDGRHQGRWSVAAGRHFGLSGAVEARDLRRLLQGRDPVTNRDLKQSRPNRPRGGWDLIFGAPKSVSLLAATTRTGAGEIQEAHVAAVSSVMDEVEKTLVLQRRGQDRSRLVADGLIGASFDHTSNAAGEPHLHTHVLVANLGSSDGVWGPVVGSEWFVGRSGLAALYQLELRAQLSQRGWDLDWRLRPDGMADVADVPRAAIRAASTQSRLAVASGRYAARAMATPQAWEERVAEATGRAPVRRGDQLRQPDALDGSELERTVAVRLTARRSDFRKWDVVVALAGCHNGGASASQAMEWADRFCRLNPSVPSPTAGGRWTTHAARRADDELVASLGDRRAAGVVAPDDLAPEVKVLTGGGDAVHFLGAIPGQSSLLAQAEALDMCRRVWEREGMRVAVSTPTAEGAARWAVLAGLSPHRAEDRPDVLVVDQADRRTTSELIRLAAGPGTRLIFVEGGTLPRLTNPASHGLMEVADRVGRHLASPHETWVPVEGADDRSRSGPPPVGRAAAEGLLAAWCREESSPLLVGLGLEEARALNRAALGLRADRAASGAAETFMPGDRVVVVKGRAGLPVYGSFGTVVDARPNGRSGRGGPLLRVAWENGESSEIADRRTLAAVGFGYAVTPHLATRAQGPLMVLGPASALGRARERVVREVEPPDRARGRERGIGL